MAALATLGFAPGAGAAPGADVTGDGVGDLVVGVPGEDSDVGAAQVIAGGAGGLAGGGFAQQGVEDIGDAAEAEDRFGSSVAVGDFNDDGHADFAVGVPGEDVSRGAVHVIFGGSPGVTDVILRLGGGGLPGFADEGDRFGSAVAAGDFNGDGIDDLVAGAPGYDFIISAPVLDTIPAAGAAVVVPGGFSGFDTAESTLFMQGHGLADEPDPFDTFGAALAVGDITGDGRHDLAVGAPGELLVTADGAGAVSVIRAGRNGLTRRGDAFLTQASRGVPGRPSFDDSFGRALAVADFDRDGFEDVAVGVRGEGSVDDLSPSGPGAVVVVPGARKVTGRGSQLIDQDSRGIRGEAGVSEAFGTALAAADFDRNRAPDLAIGIPNEGSLASRPGAAAVLYSRPGDGLVAAGDQIWMQAEDGLGGLGNPGDAFGTALAAGEFNSDRFPDLAVGDPREQVFEGGLQDAGALTAIYGGADGLAPAGNQLLYQGLGGVLDIAEDEDGFASALSGQLP